MTETKEKTIVAIGLYNLGFFGGNREGNVGIDGQYVAVTDKDEFVLIKIGDYGNLTSFPEVENPVSEALSESAYRYVHDALREVIRKDRYKGTPSESELKQFESGKKYKMHNCRISANIDHGDKVKDLKTGEVFVVNGWHDLNYINRNHNYKLVDRELHPEPATLEEFKKVNESANPFDGWKKLDAMPKKNKNCIIERYIINGETYRTTKDYSGNGIYYIQTPKGEVFEKSSSVSAPYYNAIDILVGNIKSEYIGSEGKRYEHVYKDVVHEAEDYSGTFFPTRYVKVTEAKSYDYNTRLTHF